MRTDPWDVGKTASCASESRIFHDLRDVTTFRSSAGNTDSARTRPGGS